MDRVLLYDTTLRDGAQRAGISLSLADKIQIAHLLDEFGFDYVEGGWPASNPKDAAFFRRMRHQLRHARLAAFGSTARRGQPAEKDPNLKAILEAETPVATIFGKASPFQVTEILGMTLEENLRAVEDSVRFLVDQGLEVVFDAEHFFDGALLDRSYALRVLAAAAAGGAHFLVLCDTNGGNLPPLVTELVQEALRFGVPVGIHAHDDAGVGVANSLAAVAAGAVMVQGTINGYGERCGNANLCTIWPNLVFKMGKTAGRVEKLAELVRLSRTVAEIANLAPDDGAPYVGQNAFAHKAGVHVQAVRRHPEAYEHVPPESVGQVRRILVSELSGRSNLLSRLAHFDIGQDEARQLVEEVKRLEAQGYQFEDADASMTLLLQRARGQLPEFFRVERFHVSVTKGERMVTEATVRLTVRGQPVLEVGDGEGPVHALDNALRRALVHHYPFLKDLRLTDYKVRVLDGRDATAAAVRVLIYSEFHGEPVHTVGVSRNILEASWQALIDAVQYTLWRASLAKEEFAKAAKPVS